MDEEAEYEGGGEYGDEDMADEEGGDPLREEDMDEDARATAEAILNIEARLDKAISDVNAMTVDRLANNLSKTFVSDAGGAGDSAEREKQQLLASLAASVST